VDEKITLDRNSFMALASESRIELLKKLDERRMTLSELSRELNMSKPAVLKHLNKLIEAGLVKKNEDKRKWIYYSLTFKGKNILHPERVKIILLLSSSIVSIVGAIAMLWKYIHEKAVYAAQNMGNNVTYGGNITTDASIHSFYYTSNTEFFNISLALAVIAAILLALAIILYCNKK